MRLRRWLVVLCGLVVVAPTSTVAVETDARSVRGRLVVVEFRSASGPAQQAQALAQRGLQVIDTMPGSRFVLAGVRPGHTPATGAGGPIRGLHPPVLVRAMATPNDPAYPRQWHLPAVQAPQAWDVATGAGIVVAVVDTGVAFSAPDFAGTRFTDGYDWVDDDASPGDQHGHGTHVTGTIAQTTGNGIGTAGLAHGATIMPLRALDAEGVGLDYDIAQAIRFAADRDATVINLSLGAPAGSLVLQEAVSYAASQGVTLVAAAGNEGASQVAFPAAYDAVIAVGSVRVDRTRPRYSNTGAALDMVAPGGDLSVDQNGDGYGDGVLQQSFRAGLEGDWCYCFYQGTSMATPHVAAAAALIASTGVRDHTAIRAALEASALDLGPAGRDREYGHGLLQVFDAIQAAEPAPDTGGGVGSPAPAPPAPTPEPPSATIAPHDIDDACPEEQVPRRRFGDVDRESAHGRAIDCAAWLGIASGTSQHRYEPAARVSRAQMASFLARLVEQAGYVLPRSPPDAFADDNHSVHERRIDQLAAVGATKGNLSRRYNPNDGVTRAAMASFLARTFDLVSSEDLPPGGDFFDDDDGNTHEEEIDRVAAPGLAAGTRVRVYSPGLVVSRAQMATFLVRTLDALIDAGHAPRPSS